MAINNAKETFKLLYKDINGKAISNDARAKLDSWYTGHTYGEITYEGFLKMITLVKPKKGEVF